MNTGTINFSKLSSNLIVGSRGNDMEFQEKVKQIDLEKLSTKQTLDSFEKGGNINDILYELYPNYQVTKEMPLSVFGDQFGYDMMDDISKCMRDFYAGKISQSEVEDYFEECYLSMMKYRTQQRQTSGSNAEDKQQIASEIFEVFAKENARSASRANDDEGRAMNEAYGKRKDDSVYYNSDYYYQCEETRDVLKKIVENITNKYDIPKIDTDEVIKNSGFTVDGGFDFNSVWNFSYRNQVSRSSIEDESMVPPKNFKFFYKENSFENQGSLWVSLNGKETSLQVPFSISPTGSMKGQIFYLYDLLGDSLQTARGSSGNQYMDFMSNIAIFTRWYSYCTKINDVAGNFISPKE